MSIFKTHGIVLQVGKYSEQELYYKIFFYDYGILTVKKKKKLREKPIDMGYSISCEVITHSEKNVHTIGNIKILGFFNTAGKKYSDIEAFMTLISRVKKEIPEGNPHYEIYDILNGLIEKQSDINTQKILLGNLKITSCLGSLPDTHTNMTTQKILKFIHNHSLKDILRLTDIPDETKKDLYQLV